MKLYKSYRLYELLSELPDVVRVLGGSNAVNIDAVAPIWEAHPGSITWIRGNRLDQEDLAYQTQASVIICEDGEFQFNQFACQTKCFVITRDAKLAMARILKNFCIPRQGVSPTAVISSDANTGLNFTLGHGSIIGKTVIGNNVDIGNNVTISDNVIIDDNVIIHSNVVIGEPGFNYATDEFGIHHEFPHFGGVKISSFCEIGAHSFISSGVLSPTIIEKGTKMGQYVYIGANVYIGEHSQIRARVSIMGSVKLGSYVTIAPSATLRDEITVGDKALIGMGSVVVKSVPAGSQVMGVPAKLVNA